MSKGGCGGSTPRSIDRRCFAAGGEGGGYSSRILNGRRGGGLDRVRTTEHSTRRRGKSSLAWSRQRTQMAEALWRAREVLCQVSRVRHFGSASEWPFLCSLGTLSYFIYFFATSTHALCCIILPSLLVRHLFHTLCCLTHLIHLTFSIVPTPRDTPPLSSS